jgi:trimethylamine--corrinoid protein Co-methyltransferase
MAGCLALNLAERVAIAILERVLYGDYRWELYGELVPLDMATLALQETRLEVLLANLAVIQQARHYGVPAHPFAGYHTNARLPSPEASMEKLVGALPCILAGGGHLKVGRLATGSSPVQMLLDSELVNAVRHILKGFTVDGDRLGAHVIEEVGPGGLFTGTEHTVRHMRSEFWQPSRWFGTARQAMAEGEKTKIERALEVWHDLVSRPDPEPALSEETERRLRAVIDRAARRF